MLAQLQKRRSIRKFQQQKVEAEKLKKVLQAALLAPSSRGRNPWEFVVIENEKTLQQLGQCRHPQQAFLPQTPAAIVVLGNPAISDVWVEDCSIAMTLMQLEAEQLGLGSCWIQIRRRQAQGETQSSSDFVKELLQIPAEYEVLAILALGVPAEEKPGRHLEQLAYEKIHRESFSYDFA
jgi:nitroreductase